MILNEKLNDTSKKMPWIGAAHKCKHVINSMATMGSKKIPFKSLYGWRPKIIGFSQSLDLSPTSLNRNNLGIR